MSTRQPFRLADTPLEPGVTLIEASAGTGKTFTIAGLFLRLILERDLSVRQILVVTFTEAATEELRDRIRRTLKDAAAAFREPAAANSVLCKLVTPHLDRAGQMLLRLDRALCGFDEAPILTIHSFCQRTLKDRAFESGALFDTELLTDDTPLLQEVADDYWRVRFYEAGPLCAALLLKSKLQPESLLATLRLHNRHPGLQILSKHDGSSLEEVLGRLQSAFTSARTSWQQHRADILAVAVEDTAWAKIDHQREADDMARLAAECFATDTPLPEHFDSLKFFATSSLDEAARSKVAPPDHEFFDCCQEFLAAQDAFLIALQIDFLAYSKAELPARKRARKAQTFDDLLNLLHEALRSSGGAALAHEVRAKYSAALIDEFQDTDPVQCQIFRTLFAGPEVTSLLFLIGDPKQAIYGFRGADIFTYLDAARRVDHFFTLDRNWRSESGLVHAVNTIFHRATNPFVFADIRFDPVTPAGNADDAPLTENGRRLEPFHLWFMPREDDAKSISKECAEAILPAFVAAEIARLLNEDVRLGDTRLTPRDIAVLVPENRQAGLMQHALRALDIPSVLHTEESVFTSAEARDLARVLASLSHPGSERLLRTALATSLLGCDGPALETLTLDEDQWQARLQQAHLYHERWVQEHFTPMFRFWLHEEKVRQRLLQFPDGERRLTNLLHLAEILHHAEQENHFNAPALARWLDQQVQSEEHAAEEHQLRLERDDQAVRLVTIHKSKGLEYPVVFCPFSWKSSDLRRGGDEQVLFHRTPANAADDSATEFIRDLGSEYLAEHRQLAIRERLAENLRLLYVALTRARNRCYFVWGGFKNAGSSAPAWLLHHPPHEPAKLKEALDARFKELDDPALLADLSRLAAASMREDGQRVIRAVPIPENVPAPYHPTTNSAATLAPRAFAGHIRRDWRIASFSYLTAKLLDEVPDHDRAEPPGPPPATTDADEPTGIFAFPRGTNAGSCLHKIFEDLDFTEADPAKISSLVAATLRDYGFDAAQFAPAVCENLRRVLDVPLELGNPGFTLARISNAARLNELEFLFPVEQLTPALVRGLFDNEASPEEFRRQLQRLDFDSGGGFVKGYIDLVFEHGGRYYIADWKSNWLGNRHEDYHADAMNAGMSAKFYPLQYHLYCVALHHYLARRVPGYDYDRHFGGVFYLFLRGIDPARPELGVFRDRPSRERIEAMSRALLPAQPALA